MPSLQFLSLGGVRVRDAQLSDHEPVIDGDTLSWNIMMPGSFRRNRYNNGYELIEDQQQYHQRLKLIASVLAEICCQNPHVHIICLQEAPVHSEDIRIFVNSCLEYPSLRDFAETLLDSRVYTTWGLLTLVNTALYDYEILAIHHDRDNLKNRILSLHLTDLASGKVRTLTNLHLPHESKREPQRMARFVYQMLREQGTAFTLAGDFNFSFNRKEVLQLLKNLGRVFAPKNNSTEFLMEHGGCNTLETVDAIISKEEKTVHHVRNLAQSSLLRFTGGYSNLRFIHEHKKEPNRRFTVAMKK